MSELEEKVDGELTERERREIEDREAIGAVVVHEAVRRWSSGGGSVERRLRGPDRSEVHHG